MHSCVVRVTSILDTEKPETIADDCSERFSLRAAHDVGTSSERGS